MKKIICFFVCAIVLLSLVGCASSDATSGIFAGVLADELPHCEYCDMSKVFSNDYYSILVDNDTGVLYIMRKVDGWGDLTPLLKADGTPKTVNDIKKVNTYVLN